MENNISDADLDKAILGELAGEFYAECDERLTELRRDLLTLESFVDDDQVDRQLLDAIFRAFHTVKGLTGMISSKPAEVIAHKLENYLRILRDQKVGLSQTGMDILISGTKILEEVIAANRSEKTLPETGQMISRIDALTDEIGSSPKAAAPVVPLAMSAMQLDEDEKERLQKALQQGKRTFRFEFVPSSELSKRGVNVNSIRDRLNQIGEIIKGVPCTTDNGGVSFEFLVVGQAEESLFETWLSDGIASMPYETQAKEADPVEPVKSTTAKETTTISRPTSHLAPANVVRVGLSRLDALIQMVGDLVIDRSRLEDHFGRIRSFVPNAEWQLLQETSQSLERKIRDLREGVMRVRMVQVNEVFERMRFTIRDLAGESGKQINLELSGKETELDKLIVERMMDPMMHLVRNAISHAIELPDQRKKVGKHPEGVISLRASTSGDMVVIEIEDDGHGIDSEQVAKKALAKKLIDATAVITKENVLDILCIPGFSTKDEADRASGRGVGMDVVRKTVEDLGGTISLVTEQGKGSLFRIQLPLTLAIVDALIITVGDQRFAVPKLTVLEIIEVDPDMITVSEQNEMLYYRDKVLPIVRLSRLFDLSEKNRRTFYVLVAQKGFGLVGIAVDRIINEREIVVRALSDPLVSPPGISGATELGDGQVVLILDMLGLSYVTRHRKRRNITTKTGRDASMQNTDQKSTTEPYILFELCNNTYGVPSRMVKQMEMIEQVTPVPNAPDFVEGVVFARGQVIPTINLRLRFGFEKIPHSNRSRLLVVTSDKRTVGLSVDTAREFVMISQETIQPPPEEISEVSEKYLEGITKLNDRLVLLLNVSEVLKLSNKVEVAGEE